MLATASDRKLLTLLDSLGDDSHRIDRMCLSEYQITFGIDDIELGVYTSAQLDLLRGREKIVLFADWRKRNASSLALCVVVGRVVKSVKLGDRGLELDLRNFGTLVLRRTREGENFFVNAPRAGGTFVF